MTKEKASGTPQFEPKDYDVSPSMCCWLMWCPLTNGFSICFVPYKTTLELGPEEGTLIFNLSHQQQTRQEYGKHKDGSRGTYEIIDRIK